MRFALIVITVTAITFVYEIYFTNLLIYAPLPTHPQHVLKIGRGELYLLIYDIYYDLYTM